MTAQPSFAMIDRVPTGTSGLDHILRGGMPLGRTTLVSGTAGSGKTVFGLQFLVQGLRVYDEPAVFVTFEERPDAIRQNATSLGFDIRGFEAEGKWAFVDAAYDPALEEEVVGPYDFVALLARIEHAVRVTGAQRVTVDSIGAVFTRFADAHGVRRELLRVANGLRDLGVTAVITSERADDYGEIARYGVEEFVCDNVLVLRNPLDEESRRRTVEVLKMRGVDHLSGEFPFTILPGEGIVVITLAGTDLTAGSTNERISSGLAELDEMCSAGMFRDSVTLVSGATGTGKTLLVTEFIDGGASRGERSLIISFEESRAQLARNAIGWGRDFDELEATGMLRVECVYPEVKSLEDHLVWIKRIVEEYNPERMAIDSLSALERIAPARSFREFLIGLTSFIKHRQIAGMLTATARTLLGGESTTEAHISTLTDMIVLLRYVEMGGEIRRGLTVLKLRGSTHDKKIHEFTIDNSGMHIGAPFRDVTGILAGNPRHMPASELDDLANMFDQPDL
ncbi:circadian clock protein KaiC [Nocardioides sp. HDW12B]|uniref:circadian clock protein KaiC n=1 Tax=Nocardioides sp. HDW12B TaxID=2714939 RepID=UPI00197E0D47|nr:circadian clock protein KaiC [Nocardioides sp. HDW12B]